MITKGKVISKNGNKYTVSLPIFKTSDNNKDFISEATLCYSPGTYNAINIGDIVVVGFQDNELSRPIIIGKFFSSDEELNAVGLNKVETLFVNTKATLPNNTQLGDISVSDIKKLMTEIEIIKDKLDSLSNIDDTLEG